MDRARALAELIDPQAFHEKWASEETKRIHQDRALHFAIKVIDLGWIPVSEPPGDDGCRCHACGVRYLVDINVPGDLWARIGMPTPGGLLCGRCIADRLEQFGEFDAWALVRVSDDEATVDRVARALCHDDGHLWPGDDADLVPHASTAWVVTGKPWRYRVAARAAVRALREAGQ